MKLDTVVLSLGGSVIVPEAVDVPFVTAFKRLVLELQNMRFVIICGGGKLCRKYQDAARELGVFSKSDLDWIGIRATRLNAELIRASFGSEAYEKVIHNPDETVETDRRIIIGAGFEPGSSTDLRAVQLARRMYAGTVVNMSNVDYVYTADPQKNRGAKKLEHISWADFRKLVGDSWDPGMSTPFDPIASREAERSGLRVIIIGNDMSNLGKMLRGEAFKGTTIR